MIGEVRRLQLGPFSIEYVPVSHSIPESNALAIRTPAGLVRALVRTLLLAIVLPAVIWDKDQRGFHDRIAGTMILRTR